MCLSLPTFNYRRDTLSRKSDFVPWNFTLTVSPVREKTCSERERRRLSRDPRTLVEAWWAQGFLDAHPALDDLVGPIVTPK